MSSPYEITASGTDENFDTWIARNYIGNDLKDQLRDANMLIVPIEGFRGKSTIAFPVKTEGLYQFLRDRSPDGLNVALCVEDDEYCELALHADLLVIGTFVVTSIVLPVCVGLITEYVKEKLSSRAKDSRIKVNFTVVAPDGSSKSVTFEGPAEFLGKVLTERNDDEHVGS